VAAAKLSLENHAHLSAYSLSAHDPNSQDATMHYSFDYAQQIQIPHASQQVGPLYFLAPYKVALFGIACEPASKMVIYTVPEIAVVDKGSNSVVSFLHHFFSTFGYGEKTVHLRADNCTGQNKNRYMIAYLCWRILCGLHTRITLSFLPVGHTKFYPDLGFGIFKRHLRQCSVNTVKELAQCIADSSPLSKMLIPQMVANENGDIFVPTYDWQVMFADVKTVPELKKFHHFVFDAQHQGTVKYKISSESETVSFTICRADRLSISLPNKLSPVGLSQQRKEYMYTKIRPYCPDYAKDILCPPPRSDCQLAKAAENSSLQPSSTSHASAEAGDMENTEEHVLPRVTRKPPTCSYCKTGGHRNSFRNGRFTCPRRRYEQENK